MEGQVAICSLCGTGLPKPNLVLHQLHCQRVALGRASLNRFAERRLDQVEYFSSSEEEEENDEMESRRGVKERPSSLLQDHVEMLCRNDADLARSIMEQDQQDLQLVDEIIALRLASSSQFP